LVKISGRGCCTFGAAIAGAPRIKRAVPATRALLLVIVAAFPVGLVTSMHPPGRTSISLPTLHKSCGSSLLVTDLRYVAVLLHQSADDGNIIATRLQICGKRRLVAIMIQRRPKAVNARLPRFTAP
jgi:hypothetical protein